MTTLDNPNTYPDPAAVSPWSTAIRYGLIGGLIMAVYGFLGNLVGFGRPTAGMVSLAIFGLLSFAIYIGILVFAIKKHRDEDLGGYITLGRAVLLGTVVAVVAGLIGAVFNVFYMTVIEPDYASTMIEEMTGMYENMGLGEEQIEMVVEKLQDQFAPVKMFTNGLLYAAIGGAIMSLIIGAIMKKNPPV